MEVTFTSLAPPPLHHQSLTMNAEMKNRPGDDIESMVQDGGEEGHADLSSPMEMTMQLHADEKSITSKSLLSKYYFIHKGSSRWVSTWVQCAGFPLLMLPIFLPYLLKFSMKKPFTDFNPKMLTLSIAIGLIGLMLGLNNLLFSWGIHTSQFQPPLLFYPPNCSVLLALDSSKERSNEVTREEYLVGFLCTVGAGLLFALYLPVMEKVYKKVYCYEMVMEMQLVMEIAATTLATIEIDLTTLLHGWSRDGFSHIFTNRGICTTALVSMNVLGGVVIFKDAFDGIKVVSTVLCIWGFCSYVYGLHVKKLKKAQMKNKNELSTEMINIVTSSVSY
ncbi:Purine nucleobase transmembrane transport [Sesbania bispinosa]|nr:Purine nucleobase transmembrane transport [Sesbania bispinosa]